MTAAQDAMRPHLVWNVQQVFAHIGPCDLTTAELKALSDILVVPHARWLAAGHIERPTGRQGQRSASVLKLVRQRDGGGNAS